MNDPYIGMEIAQQFKVLSRIGTGGMGTVYRAEQPEMGRSVAIKILHPRYASRQDVISRFRRESRALSHLTHPNTAKVFMSGQLENGSCYYVMEYLEGQNLAQLVRTEGPLDPLRALRIMMQVCGALQEAHRAGMIHRDLKPENIFLTTLGGISDFPKVLDFGLAKVTQREMRPGSLALTQEGMIFGTPEFMSPEQARGATLDARSDLYSLGVILYELLTGKLPFDAEASVDFIRQHIEVSPLPLSQRLPGIKFSSQLEAFIYKCLAKKPEARYASADEMTRAMQQLLDEAIKGHALRQDYSARASDEDATQKTPRVDPYADRSVMSRESLPPELPMSSSLRWIPWFIGSLLVLSLGWAIWRAL